MPRRSKPAQIDPSDLPLFSGVPIRPEDEWRGVYYFHGWPDSVFGPWLAAFFDGEGNIHLPKTTGISLSIANTNRDVIESIYHRLKVGSLELVTFDNPRWKPKWVWRVRRYDDAKAVIFLMLPYLTITCLSE